MKFQALVITAVAATLLTRHGVHARISIFTQGTVSAPVDCMLTYPPWDSVPCDPDTGIKVRIQQITPAQHGGDPCNSPRTQKQACKVDCVASYVVAANATCNSSTGMLTKSLMITTAPLNGGQVCPNASTIEVDCKVDCMIITSPWVKCELKPYEQNYFQSRTVTVSVQPKNNGAACPVSERKCIDCIYKLSNLAGNGSKCNAYTKAKSQLITILNNPEQDGLKCPQYNAKTRMAVVPC